MRHLVFFLEEPSAREMLRGVLPRILSDDINMQFVVFEGKQDLEKRLPIRLRAWQQPKKIAPSYQKVSGSRAIGPYMNIDNNYSQSFNALISRVRNLIGVNP